MALRESTVALLLALSLLGGCKRTDSGDGTPIPPRLRLGLTLPEDFKLEAIAQVDIELRAAAGEADPELHTSEVLSQVGGVPTYVRTINDGGHKALLVSFLQSPFGTQRHYDAYVYARYAVDAGPVSRSPKLEAKISIVSTTGATIATGNASLGTDGAPLRLGPLDTDQDAEIALRCVSADACNAPATAIPPGKGVVRVTVARQRVCPSALLEGDLYVILFPGSSAAANAGTSLTAVQRGVDFSDPTTEITLDLPEATANTYFLVAIHDVQGNLPNNNLTAGPGDLTSPGHTLTVSSGRVTMERLVLDQVVGIGPCTGSGHAPLPPTVTGSAPESPSNARMVTLAGTAEADALVRLHTDPGCTSVPAGEGRADANGAFSITATVTTNATTVFHGTATNAEGFTSACSTSRVTFVQDSVPPSTPELFATSPTSPSNVSDILVEGIADATSTVLLFANAACSGGPVATAQPDASGVFSAPVRLTAEGETIFHAAARDEAGNRSDCSATVVAFTRDTTPPTAPADLRTSPISPANDNTPLVLGTSEPGTSVRLFVDGACAAATDGEATADAQGRFRIPVVVVDDSESTFFAQATDPAGNVSPCSSLGVSYVERSRAPLAPVLTTTSPPSPGRTASPAVLGSAEDGSLVRVFSDSTCVVLAAEGTAAALATGLAVVVPPNRTTELHATATDVAGNTSPCSPSFVRYRHDDIAPSAPTALTTAPRSPSNNTSPSVSGSAEAGTLVALYASADCTGAPLALGTASTGGTFRLATSVSATTPFSMRATDAAGNASPCSAPLTYVLDTAPPSTAAALVQDGLTDDVAAQSDRTSLSAHWSGFTDPSGIATYRYSVSTSPACAGDVVPPIDVGLATSRTTTGLSLTDARTYYSCVRAIDAAGNASAWIASDGVTIDVTGPTAPGAPSVTAGSRQLTVSWAPSADPVSGVASYEVSYCAGAACALPATPQVTGLTATSTTLTGLSNCTPYRIAVRARDRAGNVGPSSAVVAATPSLPVPQNLVVLPGAGSAELSFTEVPNASDYRLCASTTPGSCDQEQTTGGVPAGRMTDLAFGTAFFTVQAKDGACTGPASGTVEAPLFALRVRRPLTFSRSSTSDSTSVGDVTGDGIPDVLLGGDVLSGKTGASSGLSAFGRAGDANGDGLPDLLAASTGGLRGDVRFSVLSGADGSTLYDVVIQGGCSECLTSMRIDAAGTAGDLDGDGREDQFVIVRDTQKPTLPPTLSFYTGRGAVLRSSPAPAGLVNVVALGDLDGDGRGDYALVTATAISVTSGAAALSLYDIPLPTGATSPVAARVGDMDGDGRDDFVVAYQPASGAGVVTAYSGVSGLALFTLRGDLASDRFGASVAAAGDVDGDGYADFIVGLPGVSTASVTGAGAFEVRSGPTGTLLYRHEGTVANAGLGEATLSAGRSLIAATTSGGEGLELVPGDALAIARGEVVDAATGPAPLRLHPGQAFTFSASGGTPPYVWSLPSSPSGGSIDGSGGYVAGTTGRSIDTLRVVDARGRVAETRISVLGLSASRLAQASGAVVALETTADQNGDGRADLALGMPSIDRVSVVNPVDGSTLANLFGFSEQFGTSLAWLNQVDTPNGFPPGLAIGAPASGAGNVYIHTFDGQGTATLAHTLTGEASGDGYGTSVTAAGHYLGEQLAIGAPSAGGSGRVYFVRIGDHQVQRVLTSGAAGDRFGAALASTADLDGDTVRDVAIGAPGSATTPGTVFVYSGDVGGPLLYAVTGEANGDGFGSSLAFADIDGDGVVDLVVGAPGANGGNGAAYVFSGAAGHGRLARLAGDGGGEAFGSSVSAGDLNRDGKAEVLVAAPTGGSIYVFSGLDYARLYKRADVPNAGSVVRAAGDLNSDGIGDFYAAGGALAKYLSATPSAPPLPPAGLTARIISSTQAAVGFASRSAGATSLLVERRRLGEGFAPAPESPVPASQSLVVLGGLAPNTTYVVRVKARGRSGDSRWSAEILVTTPRP